MTKAIAKQKSVAPLSAEAISKVLLQGDLSVLKPEEKVIYYNKVCELVGLNPLTKPFDYIKLNGKDVLYANKGCAEQLREIHDVGLSIKEIKTVGDVYVVVVDASMPSGRKDVGTGAVAVKGLAGEALANAFMKCETKAKRRATLSICGLNMLDETEVNSVVADPAPPVAPPVVIPPRGPVKDPAQKETRETVGAEIIAAKKTLGLTNDELQEWATNNTGKMSLKELSTPELIAFKNELQARIERTN